jgi:hypothetical protein
MSQQGTPFGAITLLNQARMSGGTWSYWPLSNANAALVCAIVAANQTHSASLCMRTPPCVARRLRAIASRSIRIVDAIKPELSAQCMLK